MTHDRLDRAVWHALIGRQASLARRHGKAMRYADDVGLFAAMEEDIPEARRDLVSLILPGGQIVLLQPHERRLHPPRSSSRGKFWRGVKRPSCTPSPTTRRRSRFTSRSAFARGASSV